MKAIKKIPSTLTKIDADGKETTEGMAWNVMPPSPDKCQICATKHEPNQPHNQQSLYYQVTFNSMIGRSPTWADALAHCDQTTQDAWKSELKKMNAWSEPPNGEDPVHHHGIE